MKKNFLFLSVTIIFFVAGFLLSCKEAKAVANPDENKKSEQQAVPNSKEANPKVALPKLLDLGADKCIPCKKMAPILDELKEQYKGKMEVVFIDVWKNAAASKKYGIRLIPTQIFFNASGKELFRHEGFFSKEEILNKWKELGIDFGKVEKVEKVEKKPEGN